MTATDLTAARHLCARLGHSYMPIRRLPDGRTLSVCRCCALHAALDLPDTA